MAGVELAARTDPVDTSRRPVWAIGLLLMLEVAGIAAMSEDSAKVGMLFGTGVGPMEAMERFCAPLFTDGAAAADPGDDGEEDEGDERLALLRREQRGDAAQRRLDLHLVAPLPLLTT